MKNTCDRLNIVEIKAATINPTVIDKLVEIITSGFCLIKFFSIFMITRSIASIKKIASISIIIKPIIALTNPLVNQRLLPSPIKLHSSGRNVYPAPTPKIANINPMILFRI